MKNLRTFWVVNVRSVGCMPDHSPNNKNLNPLNFGTECNEHVLIILIILINA